MRKKTENETTRHAAPHRQFRRSAVELAVASEADAPQVARKVLSRVRDIRNAQGEGSYVFGNQACSVFALRIGSAAGEGMLREHPGWLFGLYGADTADGKRVSFPTAEQIAEDLREHYGWDQPLPVNCPKQLNLFAAA
ncbi:hypothetical protein [Stenotrophomonas tumulicola]|uniref:Uncharacterized protein n=1 Tax=Stenotrophomonas tumulicola TaxID=1685415 RepID=A0A7W3FJ54_9GAMM|nr:hypothetical protein [Stenotrophomonas tumulicola]MBA8680501.1 hypothetical protein [Stenotrophomonas tumulicola]